VATTVSPLCAEMDQGNGGDQREMSETRRNIVNY
jgi:hypothetical protein